MASDAWLKQSLDYAQQHFSSNISTQRKSYLVTGGSHKINIHRGNMKEEIESDVKIGDVVRLLTTGNHNFDTPEININIYFEDSEIGNLLKINDIIKDSRGDIAFKVECKMGTTYLRRNAFEIIKCAPQPKEDLSYLIPLLESNNII